MTDRSEMQAELFEYLPYGLMDHADDGTFANNDASILRIDRPPHLMGRRLSVYHGKHQRSASILTSYRASSSTSQAPFAILA